MQRRDARELLVLATACVAVRGQREIGQARGVELEDLDGSSTFDEHEVMRRHGATVAGSTVREVVFRCIYMAANAKMQMGAAQLGPYQTLSPAEIRMTVEFNIRPYSINRAWERWVRRAARRA
jgi:ribulose-5-phosphate 4-epimerase/fuculose-1-phosphate aldolase